ncbi:BDNF/NT-3 growth factors receptor-like protein [Leptotrombidium deliense]|uniref:BDNF/NT-3 growth factors receptor-like protein n=1 Tax=Leptotrombidium deliense TaxID=299467 RepID=A0A443SGR3_9ACAR|nr:BDNF/NT-3 growth factors receptor-like protein [Leptotrombidium deliense]
MITGIPQVVVNPREVIINESSQAELLCTATGKPKPRVYWNVTGLQSDVRVVDIESVDLIANKNGESIELDYTSQVLLTFNNTKVEDNRLLACFAENIVGKAYGTALLQINTPPKVINLRVMKKFYQCIIYLVIGVPPPTRIWYFNDEPLNMTDNIRELVYETKHRYYQDGCLQIEQATHVNDGLYTLQVINEFGEHNKSIEAQFLEDIPLLLCCPIYSEVNHLKYLVTLNIFTFHKIFFLIM